MKYIKKFERFSKIWESEEYEDELTDSLSGIKSLNELRPGMNITKCFYEQSSIVILTDVGYLRIDCLGEEVPEVIISGPGLTDDYSSVDDDPETYYKNPVSEFTGKIKNVIEQEYLFTIETEDGKKMKIYK